jgi:hypothetical protein
MADSIAKQKLPRFGMFRKYDLARWSEPRSGSPMRATDTPAARMSVKNEEGHSLMRLRRDHGFK